MEHPGTLVRSIAAAATSMSTRRSFLKRFGVLGISVPAVFGLLAACAEDDDEPAVDAGETDDDDDEDSPEAPDDDEETDDVEDDEPEDESDDETEDEGTGGGTFRVALVGEPPTLDIHRVTASIVAIGSWHIWEPLFTWDEEFQLVPDLAESLEAADDATSFTITLRQGVLFHNGEEMTADDVIASIERWNELDVASILTEITEEIVEVDDYTIEYHLTEPIGVFGTNLARQNAGCAIHPRSILEESGTDEVTEYIGTGPFEFVEHVPDRRILLRRFEDYVSRDEPSSGYSGEKNVYFDELEFIPVPDEAARVAGLRAGDYHYLETVSAEQVVGLGDDPNLVVEELPAMRYDQFTINWESPITSDLLIRQAIQAALNHEEMAEAAWGGQYILQPGLFHEGTAWHSTAGEDLYNRNDPETARELLEEAGYDGTPLRFLTTQEYSYMGNGSQVGAQQLEDAGFEIDLEIMDWATLTDLRDDPDRFELTAGGTTFRVEPIMNAWLTGCSWSGWWCDEEKEELSAQLSILTEFEDRFEIFERLQEKFYEDVGMIKGADELGATAIPTNVSGLVHFPQLRQFFWNVRLE